MFVVVLDLRRIGYRVTSRSRAYLELPVAQLKQAGRKDPGTFLVVRLSPVAMSDVDQVESCSGRMRVSLGLLTSATRVRYRHEWTGSRG